MHMVRHHHERIAHHHGHVFGYRIPTPLNNVAHGIRHHHVIHHTTEQRQSPLRAYRDVIRAGAGVIVPAQPDGSAMETVGHGIPNIGIAG